MNWKPPSITTRTAEYLRKIGHLSDADKLEYFDNIVGAAFRKGYNVRKGDELKMRGEKVHNVEFRPLDAALSPEDPLERRVMPR